VSSARIRDFLRDERGSYTIWSLIWFMLYVAIGGLAVDVTDAYRNEIMLQSTADASAMAAVFELPSASAATAQALAYSADNMDPSFNGDVLLDAEVVVGDWNFGADTFTPDDVSPNAVWVVTRRAEQNQNPVGMNFLRILALFGLTPQWNISTEAIAVRFVPDCVQKNGLVAHNKVDVTSNNHFEAICVHGQNLTLDPGLDYAIDIANNNVIEPGSQFSMPDLSMMNGRPNVYTNNTGLEDSVVEGDMLPQAAYIVDEIIAGYLTGPYPNYMYQQDPAFPDDPTALLEPTKVNVTENYNGPYEPYHVYIANCSSSAKTISIPQDTVVDKVVLVADCRIDAGAGVWLKNAVIASSAKGNGVDELNIDGIHFASHPLIGDAAFCGDSSGQVHLYTSASMMLAAGPAVYGLRMVAGGSIQFTAQGDVTGISAESGANITATANGNFAYCPGGVLDGPYAWSYRLVK